MAIVKQGMFFLSCAVMLMAQQKDVIITRAGAATGGVGVGGPVGAPVGMIGTFNFVAGEMVGGSPVKGAPYSAQAVTESTQTLADGNRIANSTSAAVYRDSEGRERREQTLPNIGPFAAQGPPPKTIFISDPVAGVNYSLDPNNKVAVKLAAVKMPDLPPPPAGNGQPVFVKNMAVPVPGPAAGMIAAGPNVMYFRSASGGNAPAPNVEHLGSQVINGISVDGTRTTLTIPAGQIGNDKPIQIVDEVWRSPELQVIVQSQHSDPRMGDTTYSLTNVSRSEPSPALFQVPPDYTVKDGPARMQMTMPPAQ